MTLITKVSVQNFKCYRKMQHFELGQSNFFIGANNAWKSAVLKAIHCFFDENQYQLEFLNKNEFRSRLKNYNKTTVGITFDLKMIHTKSIRENLKKEYWETLTIYRNFTYKENTNLIYNDYEIKWKDFSKDELSSDIEKLLSKIIVSYIHPQEAKELMQKAQEKLKSRLLSNWWRSPDLATNLNKLQDEWTKLRKLANTYLSKWLTDSLQNIWPWCQTNVDLPEQIEQIIWVSEINFRGSVDLPVVSLTSQWTGAQSTILYQTHYLLDSDKTLHRGFYYPIWLIEEPESFLHADIIFKLGHLLCSDRWLDNIQMMISTHSPLLLSTSKSNEWRIKWFLINEHSILKNKKVSEWNIEEIKEIWEIMGDPNFDVYLQSSDKQPIIIEDTRELSEKKLQEAWINVTQRLRWTPELRRYFDVLRTIKVSIWKAVYFLIDNDKGLDDFKNVISEKWQKIKEEGWFKKYKFENNVYLIVFPENCAMEELFEEYDSVLENCVAQLFNSTYTKPTSNKVPANLSRVHAHIRDKTSSGLEEAKKMIRNQQDVKDLFWWLVETKNYQIQKVNSSSIINLMKD